MDVTDSNPYRDDMGGEAQPSSNRRQPSDVGRSRRPAVQVSSETLRALTPAGIFTNLFPIAVPSGSLGPVLQTPTSNATKRDFSDRRRPTFYQAPGGTLFAYGAGLDDFEDPRFTRGIVTSLADPFFTRHLLSIAVGDFFKSLGYPVRRPLHQVAVLDPVEAIHQDGKGILGVHPEFLIQVHIVEDSGGHTRYAASIEPSWTTVPKFLIDGKLRGHANLLRGLRLVVAGHDCLPTCPLYEMEGRTIGIFEDFAPADTPCDCTCGDGDFQPLPVRVLDRKGVHNSGPRRLVIPGQQLRLAQGQRGVLKLFERRADIERKGRQWLGDYTSSGSIGENALMRRYLRVQEFLARAACDALGPLALTLATGAHARVERIPLLVEQVRNV